MRIGAQRLLDIWKASWACTSRSTPWPLETDSALDAEGSSILELKMACTTAASKHKRKRNAADRGLLEMLARTKIVQESFLQQNLSQAPNGGIFLLKSLHQYRDASQLEVTGNISLEEALQVANGNRSKA